MHTIVTITVVAHTEDKATVAIDKIYKELDRLAGLLNFYDEKSELSAINRNAGVAAVKVSPETIEIIEQASKIGTLTGGAFDMTVGPLIRLWDFSKHMIPNNKAVSDARRYTDYRAIIVDRTASTVFITKRGVSIDLGGIIKGYAADKAVQLLKREGITAGIAAIGGDIRFFGARPDGTRWVTGIQNPRQTSADDEIVATIDMGDGGISTSGDYMKFFEKDGVRFHHIIDPATGFPAAQCGSVTVVAPLSAESDALATGLFVLGTERGLNAAKQAGVEALFIDCVGRRVATPGLAAKIRYRD